MLAHDHCHIEDTGSEVRPIQLGRKLAITLVVFVALFALSAFLPVLAAFHHSLLAYLGVVWWAVLLGLLLGGVIDYFVPGGFIAAILGPGRRFALVNAVLAGFAMSACSHGILAISMQLYKKGAGVPAVVTFLLASPWANMPMTILLFGFFGWRAVLFVGGAMLVAFVTGVIFILLGRAGLIEGAATEAATAETDWHRLRHFALRPALRGVFAGAVSLANMVLWWVLLGILFAAAIGAYVPKDFFLDYLGPDISGLSLTLLVASLIEVCSEGTSPIAFEIFNKVGAFGNPFVFLMAGVATDYTEIGLIWTNIGKKAALWLPVVTVPQILLLGVLFNLL